MRQPVGAMMGLMIRRTLLTAVVLLSASLAQASEPKPDAKGGKDGKGAVGQYVDLQPVALPIVSERRLVNYVFVNVRLNLTTSANAAKLREKEPFFRDALVRAAHRTPFTNPADLSTVDVPRLTAALMRDATTIAGAGQIRTVAITSQAPRRRLRPTAS